MSDITVSISSYNQEGYLPDAIESVLNQKFMVGNLQLLVIDDGSTDNSLEIANKYWGDWVKDKNAGKSSQVKDFRVISQVNKGLSSARNTGIMNAIGDWFLPLDADDILLDTCIHKVWSRVNKFFPPDVLGLSFKEFGLRNTIISLMPDPSIEDFKVANRIGYCSAIKKEALLEVGGYSPRMFAGYEDLHLWYNLLVRGKKIATIPEICWLYRTKEKSMIHDALAHHEELMTQIFKDFPQITKVIDNPLPHDRTS